MIRSTFDLRMIFGLLVALQGCAPHAAGGAVAQQQAQVLSVQAAEEAEEGRWAEAAELWLLAAEQYRLAGDATAAAGAYRGAGRANEALGREEQALALYGQATALENPQAAERIVQLIEGTPVTRPTLSLEREAAYIAAVKTMIQESAGSREHAERISSAEEAMELVEALAGFLTAPIQVVSDGGVVPVQYRRWKHRRSTSIPWNPVRTDTTVSGTPAWYQFRYPVPGTARDTTIDVSCADGCLVRVPGP